MLMSMPLTFFYAHMMLGCNNILNTISDSYQFCQVLVSFYLQHVRQSLGLCHNSKIAFLYVSVVFRARMFQRLTQNHRNVRFSATLVVVAQTSS
jgi:hypothetical protein